MFIFELKSQSTLVKCTSSAGQKIEMHILKAIVVTVTIGKTDRTLLEQAYKDQESAVNKHLNSFYETNYLDSKTSKGLTEFVPTNWNLLLYKEALHIKRRKSILNNGLKASRKLQLLN